MLVRWFSFAIALAVVTHSFGAHAQTSCPTIEPIPDMRAHVGFPVDYTAKTSGTNIGCGTLIWKKASGPTEFNIDNAGGLFYWSPAATGAHTITIRLENAYTNQVIDEDTFIATVDDNTITYPLHRDYLRQATSVDILGRAHDPNFVSYKLDYAPLSNPTSFTLIAGPITTQVTTTGKLATWNIASLPDGGRYILRLTVNLTSGTSVLTNPVILDRSAKLGWPKRINAISHSVVLADLDDDNEHEVMAVTHSGELWVWNIDGDLLWTTGLKGWTYSAPSVGNIDNDPAPEIVWATGAKLYAYDANGTVLPGFPVSVPSGGEFRSVPTLADLDGDGRLEILLGAMGSNLANAQVVAYRYVNGSAQMIAGWPQTLNHWSQYTSVAVGDLDHDGTPEIVTQSYDTIYAWRTNGVPFPGLHGALLPAPITNAITNGAGGVMSTSQPAIADLDLDGAPEIIVGSYVFTTAGTQKNGWQGGKTGAQNTLSPAIGNIDNYGHREVVLGRHAWYANGTSYPNRPLSGQLGSAILADCGYSYLDTILGTRQGSDTTRGITAFHPSGGLLNGYPKSLYGETGDAGAPVVGDFDNDGLIEVAVAITDANYGGIVAVYDMPGENHDEGHDWPMLGHNVQHTGFYMDPPPNRPKDVQADSNGSAVALSWIDQSNVESGYVVERSPTGAPFSYVTIANLPANAAAYNDASAPPGSSHRVRAKRVDTLTGKAIYSPAALAEEGCAYSPGGSRRGGWSAAILIAALLLLQRRREEGAC